MRRRFSLSELRRCIARRRGGGKIEPSIGGMADASLRNGSGAGKRGDSVATGILLISSHVALCTSPERAGVSTWNTSASFDDSLARALPRTFAIHSVEGLMTVSLSAVMSYCNHW